MRGERIAWIAQWFFVLAFTVAGAIFVTAAWVVDWDTALCLTGAYTLILFMVSWARGLWEEWPS